MLPHRLKIITGTDVEPKIHCLVFKGPVGEIESHPVVRKSTADRSCDVTGEITKHSLTADRKHE